MILLGLGSNLGDRAQHLALAREKLLASGVRAIRASSEIETAALLPEGAPAEWNIPFLNQVLQVETTHAPLELLAVAKAIEAGMGRQENGRWGPREIDIDILAYHDVVLGEPPLQLPHPQMHLRDFVLRPLAEIAPEWRYPAHGPHCGKRALELLAELPS